ncbi:hypothetical protein LCIT_11300 [Leuconostoc citreum]|uniref:Uncharacterized protein n=1 Tax=Leuconostoc citreum TaxID=33964 RepID=A0A5A5U0A9_LEUCI|nr:hypothetical protein [Leuconostoc citreum]GDZ83888.1 hypothetical protein LCIT_11300 [Leuconostoc citreum]
MQRKPFKQSHRLRYLLVGLLIVAVIIVATVILGQHGGKKTSETSQSTSQSSQSQNKSNSTSSTSATSSNAPVSSTDEASSVVVPSVPSAASSAASEAIHAVVNDGTQTPIADNQTSAPQVAASSSVAIPAPKAVTFGNWTLANFNTVKLGSATYDQVKASYGNPTNLVASDTVTANWISTSGAKVTIVFTPTGDNKNLQLVANYKVQSGLQ